MLRRIAVRRALIGAVALTAVFAASRAEPLRPGRDALIGAAAPIFGSLRRATDWVASRVGGSGGERIRALERERIELLAEIARLGELRRENELLRQALVLRAEGEAGVIPATAVAFFREGREEFLLLDRGTDQGIGVGDLILDRRRVLAGTVVEVSRRSARAILLTSPSRSTEVTIAGRDLRAVARGDNGRELAIDLVPQDAEIAVGDLIVASPRLAGGRRSLLVGEVREVRRAEQAVFKTVRAVHLFDPAEDALLVLLAP